MDKTPEKLLPYNENDSKHIQIKKMFDNIAPSYDLLNRIMSFGLDRSWRNKAIKQIKKENPLTILDVATGTGDFAIETYKKIVPEKITGIDLSEGMMEIAKNKVKEAGYENKIVFEKQDCLSLNFKNSTFDAVTISFGIRNFENIKKGVEEIYRVLKPGGTVYILELSRPVKFPFKQLFNLYSLRIIPFFGKIFAKDKKAYEYLPKSIQMVPQSGKMIGILNETGFESTYYQTFTFGVCTLYKGRK